MTALAFQKQKAIGDAGERRVLIVLAEAGWKVGRRNKLGSRDLEVSLATGTEFVEVKNEDNYAGSDNICIEWGQGRITRPSGIQVSESTACVHTLRDECAVFRTTDMRLKLDQYIRNGTYQVRPLAGADNFNVGILVPKISLRLWTFAEILKLEDLPKSRVFNATRA